MAKTPIVQYGITITKPWSNEMYDHNAEVLRIAKESIQSALDLAYGKHENEVDDICYPKDDLYIIAKEICAYGWGSGTYEEVYEDACNTLENSASWWINDIYPYLQKWNYVPALEKGFVGF